MVSKVGQKATLSKTITEDDVKKYAKLVGDVNPVHIDEDFAKKTRFGKRIAHGMWGASLISAVLGTQLPGPGTIYLSQSLQFKAPIFIGDTVTATVVVSKVLEDKPTIILETTCTNQHGDVVIQGEAVVLVEEVG